MGKSRKNPSLYQLIDRKKFDQLAEKWNIDKGVRSLTTWELTCALVDFMTLQLESYRDIEETLGIPRSTLSDALAGRCSGFFQDLCDQILLDIRGRTHNRKLKRAIRQLLAIDSTECDVHGSLFDRPKWAKKRGEGRQASCKLHVVWDIDGEWVDDFSITGARKHDSPASLNLRIQSGKTYVFDRAYNDLDFWLKIIGADSHFVTRLKDCQKNADLRMFALAMADGEDGVLYDGDYEPSQSIASRYKEQLQGVHLRHIIYRDPETKKVFDFVTSDVDVPAQEIADIYKRRWAVGVSRKGRINPVGESPTGVKDSSPVAREAA